MQNPGMLKRSSTVRRRKAHDDLRTSAYASKPLPPLLSVLPEVATDSQAPGDSQGNRQRGESQLHMRKLSMLDGAVRSMKDVAYRFKSRYARHKKKVRLSLAWEVEEIV